MIPVKFLSTEVLQEMLVSLEWKRWNGDEVATKAYALCDKELKRRKRDEENKKEYLKAKAC